MSDQQIDQISTQGENSANNSSNQKKGKTFLTCLVILGFCLFVIGSCLVLFEDDEKDTQGFDIGEALHHDMQDIEQKLQIKHSRIRYDSKDYHISYDELNLSFTVDKETNIIHRITLFCPSKSYFLSINCGDNMNLIHKYLIERDWMYFPTMSETLSIKSDVRVYMTAPFYRLVLSGNKNVLDASMALSINYTD